MDWPTAVWTGGLALLPLGFTRVFNLSGGIDAYSETVDSTVPRY